MVNAPVIIQTPVKKTGNANQTDPLYPPITKQMSDTWEVIPFEFFTTTGLAPTFSIQTQEDTLEITVGWNQCGRRWWLYINSLTTGTLAHTGPLVASMPTGSKINLIASISASKLVFIESSLQFKFAY